MAASRAVRRSILTLLAAAVLAMTLAVVPAAAQTDPSPTTTDFDFSNCTGALPRPGCGEAPQASGDRGGSAQIFLFFFLLAGTAAGLTYVALRVRKGTQARADAVTGDWS